MTGTVTDSHGNPVGAAEIWIYTGDSPIDERVGVGVTDAAGRFSVTSSERNRLPQAVRALKNGYLPRDVRVDVSAPPARTARIVLPRTGWVIAKAPGTATIGAHYYGVPAMVEVRVNP